MTTGAPPSPRARVSAPIAAALAEIGDAGVCLALIANPGADLPGFALGRMVARHGQSAALREALLARRDLPASAHQALIRAVAGALSAFVVERAWLDADDAADLARDASERATLALADGCAVPDLRAFAEHLQREGDLTPAFALRALLSGRMRLFLEVVAALSGLPTDRVAALAADRSGYAFRTLYDRIGLPDGAYVAFRSALYLLQREPYLDDEDPAVGLKRRIVETVLQQYVLLGEDAARNPVVALLQRWRGEAADDERRVAA